MIKASVFAFVLLASSVPASAAYKRVRCERTIENQAAKSAPALVLDMDEGYRPTLIYPTFSDASGKERELRVVLQFSGKSDRLAITWMDNKEGYMAPGRSYSVARKISSSIVSLVKGSAAQFSLGGLDSSPDPKVELNCVLETLEKPKAK